MFRSGLISFDYAMFGRLSFFLVRLGQLGFQAFNEIWFRLTWLGFSNIWLGLSRLDLWEFG